MLLSWYNTYQNWADTVSNALDHNLHAAVAMSKYLFPDFEQNLGWIQEESGAGVLLYPPLCKFVLTLVFFVTVLTCF